MGCGAAHQIFDVVAELLAVQLARTALIQRLLRYGIEFASRILALGNVEETYLLLS